LEITLAKRQLSLRWPPDGLVPVFPASITHLLLLALSSVQVRLKEVEEDIE
jgi:hypothetical protein